MLRKCKKQSLILLNRMLSIFREMNDKETAKEFDIIFKCWKYCNENDVWKLTNKVKNDAFYFGTKKCISREI